MPLTLVDPTRTAGLAPRARRIRIALAGNPNCGKTSLFNALTGANQHVANYAGVTVDRRSGTSHLILDGTAEVIDLPGTYSLSAYSPEERVAEAELATAPDVVVIVVDSTQLQRHLVLLVQVLQAGANPVLCLNMADEAHSAGQRIDLAQMERLLGFPVVETVGHRRRGLGNLVNAIHRAIDQPIARHRLVLGDCLDLVLRDIKAALPVGAAPARSADWVATRLLMGDESQARRVAGMPGGQAAVEMAQQHRARLEAETRSDISVFVTEQYFGFVDGLLREVRSRAPRADARQLTDRIDAFVVHPFVGLPLFAAVMFALFWVTFVVGDHPMQWIEGGVAWTGTLVSSLWPDGSDSPLRSLLVDGIIGGVGGVIVFLPNILLLFLGLAFLEDTGYMARAAFLTDRLMHRFGLHGKSFIPLVTGFGCSIPGIMATRTLEHERDRLTTMLVLPLMSCGARLPIWMLLVPAFVPSAWRAPVLWLIYALGIGLALVLALTLRRTLLRGEDAPFVMELPPYRLPTLRSVVMKMLHSGKSYLRKAGTTILVISILLWAATSYPKSPIHLVDAQVAAGTLTVAASEDGCATSGAVNDRCLTPSDLAARRAAEDLEYSVAGRVGHALAPVFAPLGFDWRIVTAMVGAFAAKEVFVAQMGIVYSLADGGENAAGLATVLARDYSPLVGISLMVFLLVAAPCMATVAVTRRESGGWRWALLQFGGLSAIGYLLALVIYQVGRLVI
jgi:ferrous iron transport protein B